MSTTDYRVLPANRASWSVEAERFALALYAGTDDRGELAALGLMFRDPHQVFARDDVRRSVFYRTRGGETRLDWAELASATEGMKISPGERARILLACSIASTQCPVFLSVELPRLDDSGRADFIAALAYAAGR